MGKTLELKNLVVISKNDNEIFSEKFAKDVTIVTGRNTSGKSTVFLSIIYTFGINDVKQQLSEILDYDPIFRVDFRLKNDASHTDITVIREDEIIYIKKDEGVIKSFNGIGGNNSKEHIKLKEFWADTFSFNLFLESKSEYKLAPIEAIFLPFYISQSLGWIYLRKSFSSFDFYRNFKEDYIDYYLGIQNTYDRLEKQKTESELNSLNTKYAFLSEYEYSDEELQISKIVDEEHIEYVDEYLSENGEDLSENILLENQILKLVNDIGYYKQRKSILQRIKRNTKSQEPGIGNCPTCSQILPDNIESFYVYKQGVNDTESELNNCKDKLKTLQSSLNSKKEKLGALQQKLKKTYKVFLKAESESITVEKWLDQKTNVKLLDSIHDKVEKIKVEQELLKEKLKEFKSDDEIEKDRNKWRASFRDLFLIYLQELGVRIVYEDRYTDLYRISAFPYQGVELHKCVLAYNFAFLNTVIKANSTSHFLPLMLDAIFKEDIEPGNKELIVDFISKHTPVDLQLIFSIAELKDHEEKVSEYNENFFNDEAYVIELGDRSEERSFFRPIANDEENLLIQETHELIELAT
jgi:hypothetical protein